VTFVKTKTWGIYEVTALMYNELCMNLVSQSCRLIRVIGRVGCGEVCTAEVSESRQEMSECFQKARSVELEAAKHIEEGKMDIRLVIIC
jgi:hypothetical protein